MKWYLSTEFNQTLNYLKDNKFPALSTPNKSYNDIKFSENNNGVFLSLNKLPIKTIKEIALHWVIIYKINKYLEYIVVISFTVGEGK